jgi:hypothetical protein
MNEQESELPAIEPLEDMPPLCVDKSPDLADQVYQRMTKTGMAALNGKRDIIARRVRTFVLDGMSCAPDVFVDAEGNYLDFEVTLRSLSSVEEIQALNGINDPGEAPFRLAKASLYAINGKPISGDRKDFFWEAFGMQGRQICMMAFAHVGSASGAALGKFQRTISVG